MANDFTARVAGISVRCSPMYLMSLRRLETPI